ncbi:single-stranded DNA-binding protein [Actinomadura madurae]|uniref:single-stranded DNA-binding protein n=1 Tax=Actinomadura madurae TaxID=1993 RepID=UPI0020D23830|nr:single-stranded DNA-binding protein [Actinomadura madurae]MCQ0009551.1 single-stranded DNA-binding protein [Actinomadura madurae]
MNEAHVTITGWVAAEPRYAVTANGHAFLSLRVGCTPRRFDRQTGQWQDDEALYVTVNCWRHLADNVNASELRRGTPVLVSGRLRIRQYERDDQWRFSAEVEAMTLGPDLSRGTVDFRPAQRSGPPHRRGPPARPRDGRPVGAGRSRRGRGGAPSGLTRTGARPAGGSPSVCAPRTTGGSCGLVRSRKRRAWWYPPQDVPGDRSGHRHVRSRTYLFHAPSAHVATIVLHNVMRVRGKDDGSAVVRRGPWWGAGPQAQTAGATGAPGPARGLRAGGRRRPSGAHRRGPARDPVPGRRPGDVHRPARMRGGVHRGDTPARDARRRRA